MTSKLFRGSRPVAVASAVTRFHTVLGWTYSASAVAFESRPHSNQRRTVASSADRLDSRAARDCIERVATVSADTTAPVISDFGLRRGNVRSGDSADWYATRALSPVGAIIQGRQVLLRADSAFCGYDNVQASTKAGAWCSLTIPVWKTVNRAIAATDDKAWVGIKYPNAIFDEQAGGWVSDAEVAETRFVAFVSRITAERVACRLVVRRVKRLGPAADTGQGELFDTHGYHAFTTHSTLDTVTADKRHRGHAIVEQVMAELKAGPLAHLPSVILSRAQLQVCDLLERVVDGVVDVGRSGAHGAVEIHFPAGLAGAADRGHGLVPGAGDQQRVAELLEGHYLVALDLADVGATEILTDAFKDVLEDFLRPDIGASARETCHLGPCGIVGSTASIPAISPRPLAS